MKMKDINLEKELLKLCLSKGILLDTETFKIISQLGFENAKKLIEKISILNVKMITKSFILQNVEKIKEIIEDERIIERIKLNFGVELEISKISKKKEEEEKKIDNNLKILQTHVNITKKLKVSDFVNYFRNRFLEMKNFLQERPELDNLVSINKINNKKQNISIIGIVFNKRITKNKNIILELEDLTGRINVLVNKDREDIYNIAKEVLVDDVIGVKGVGDREILFANKIVYPEAYILEKNYLEKDENVAFISDIHIGSKKFFEKNFLKFIEWLNGDSGDDKQRKEAKKVKYLFIVGDCVDGVGIYPDQEEELLIKDVKEQYEKLAEYLSLIRKDIKIIICPGQHDAVRVAEPQPPISQEYAPSLYKLENVILVSNPAIIEITNNEKKGIKILIYHGASLNSFVNEIEHLRISKAHDNPSQVVKEILKRRHLAPLHSSVTYIPTTKDPLLIREAPDVIVTADFHRPDTDYYNNIQIICCSCWQDKTPFEERVGNNPDPCKVPILNLKTRKLKILDFS